MVTKLSWSQLKTQFPDAAEDWKWRCAEWRYTLTKHFSYEIDSAGRLSASLSCEPDMQSYTPWYWDPKLKTWKEGS